MRAGCCAASPPGRAGQRRLRGAARRHYAASEGGAGEEELGGGVAIVGFRKLVDVFGSKQLPKRLTVVGEDLREYEFIVKVCRSQTSRAQRRMKITHSRPSCDECSSRIRDENHT